MFFFLPLVCSIFLYFRFCGLLDVGCWLPVLIVGFSRLFGVGCRVLIVDCRLSVVAVVFSGFRVSVVWCWLLIVCVCCLSVFPCWCLELRFNPSHVHGKKRLAIFPSPAGMSLTWPGIMYIIFSGQRKFG
jgi:hypothetical protein